MVLSFTAGESCIIGDIVQSRFLGVHMRGAFKACRGCQRITGARLACSNLA
jgi:hypothetical protein